jgi:hypothetical protein
MVHDVRKKDGKTPGDGYTIAVCDACKSTCPESRLSGRHGTRAADEAEAVARAAGWAERLTKDDNPRRRRLSWVVQLLCPACQASTPTEESRR